MIVLKGSLTDIEALDKKAGVDLLELFHTMQSKEKIQGPSSRLEKDLRKRESVISYMQEITERFSLHSTTCFTGINYFDRICHEFPSDVKSQGKVGLMCLLLASKYEEKEINTPPLSYFCEHSTSLFSDMDEILLYERNIVEALRWNFGAITVAHYAELLEAIGVLFQDDTCYDNKIRDSTKRYVNDFLHFFVCLSTAEPLFSTFSPSIQITAIIIATRRATGVQPVWRDELEKLLRVSFQEALDCYELLWKLFKERYPEKTQDTTKASPTNPYVVVQIM